MQEFLLSWGPGAGVDGWKDENTPNVAQVEGIFTPGPLVRGFRGAVPPQVDAVPSDFMACGTRGGNAVRPGGASRGSLAGCVFRRSPGRLGACLGKPGRPVRSAFVPYDSHWILRIPLPTV